MLVYILDVDNMAPVHSGDIANRLHSKLTCSYRLLHAKQSVALNSLVCHVTKQAELATDSALDPTYAMLAKQRNHEKA